MGLKEIKESAYCGTHNTLEWIVLRKRVNRFNVHKVDWLTKKHTVSGELAEELAVKLACGKELHIISALPKSTMITEPMGVRYAG